MGTKVSLSTRLRNEAPLAPLDLSVTRSSPPEIDLADPRWYLNRELTWLAFKRRVLNEAADERLPLLERLKFIAIVSGNIDEFFMKRIGGLKQQIGAGVRELTPDGRTPRQQVQECYALVRELEADKNELLRRLLKRLHPKGISIVRTGDLSAPEKKLVCAFYESHIFPLLKPEPIDRLTLFPSSPTSRLIYWSRCTIPKPEKPPWREWRSRLAACPASWRWQKAGVLSSWKSSSGTTSISSFRGCGLKAVGCSG